MFVDLLDSLFHQPCLLQSLLVLPARGAEGAAVIWGTWGWVIQQHPALQTSASEQKMNRFVPNTALYHTPTLGSKGERTLFIIIAKLYQTGCSDWAGLSPLSTPLTAIFTRLRGKEKNHDFNVELSILLVIPHLCNFHLTLE